VRKRVGMNESGEIMEGERGESELSEGSTK